MKSETRSLFANARSASASSAGTSRRSAPPPRASTRRGGETRRTGQPRRAPPPVAERHRQAGLFRDDLPRLFVDERERGPQDRVWAADLVDGPPERVHVESAPQPVRARQAVDGAARLEPLEEPEALLREGEG